MPAFLRKRLPDGATRNWGSRHLIATYYSFIDPEGVKGWVGVVGWPIADGLITHMSGHSSATGRAQGRESSPAKDRRSAAELRNQPACCSDDTHIVTGASNIPTRHTHSWQSAWCSLSVPVKTRSSAVHEPKRKLIPYTHTTVLRSTFRDYPGEPVPGEN